MTFDKTTQTVLALAGVAAAVWAVAAGYNDLDKRIELLSALVDKIDKSKAEGPCLSIANRQIRALDRKNSTAVKKELQGLSNAYGCSVIADAKPASFDPGATGAGGVMIGADPASADADLEETLRAIDEQINKLAVINDDLATKVAE